MKPQRDQSLRLPLAVWTAVILGLGLTACGGGTPAATDSIAASADSVDAKAQALASRSRTATLVAQPANTRGRLLASNCFQCHGTLGTGGFDSIRGSEASEVLEFMGKTANRDIMAAHAQGYTRAQLLEIIAYLQQ